MTRSKFFSGYWPRKIHPVKWSRLSTAKIFFILYANPRHWLCTFVSLTVPQPLPSAKQECIFSLSLSGCTDTMLKLLRYYNNTLSVGILCSLSSLRFGIEIYSQSTIRHSVVIFPFFLFYTINIFSFNNYFNYFLDWQQPVQRATICLCSCSGYELTISPVTLTISVW